MNFLIHLCLCLRCIKEGGNWIKAFKDNRKLILQVFKTKSIYKNGEYRTAGLAYNNEVSDLMQVYSVSLESVFTGYVNSQVELNVFLNSSAEMLHGHSSQGCKRYNWNSK